MSQRIISGWMLMTFWTYPWWRSFIVPIRTDLLLVPRAAHAIEHLDVFLEGRLCNIATGVRLPERALTQVLVLPSKEHFLYDPCPLTIFADCSSMVLDFSFIILDLARMLCSWILTHPSPACHYNSIIIATSDRHSNNLALLI